MGRKLEDISELYDVAEEENSCLAAVTEALRKKLCRHVREDDLVCPLPNLYERRSTWEALNPNQRAIHVIRGLSALRPSWVFCHASAALIHGLEVSYSCSHEVHVLSSGGSRPAPSSARVPRAQRAADTPTISFHQPTCFTGNKAKRRQAPVKIDGVWVTSALDTVLDCLCTIRFDRCLGIADSYLSKEDKTSEDLLSATNRLRRGCKGIAEARRTASLSDPRAENGGESFARARMIELGYRIPELQVTFHDSINDRSMRADFLWRLESGRTIAGELDGMSKYTDPSMTGDKDVAAILVNQNMRDSRLGLHVDAVMHFTYEIAKNDLSFCTVLDAYGIPKQLDPW